MSSAVPVEDCSLPHHIEFRAMKISTDANFPMDAAGRVYHLGVRRGEIANRILQVGDPSRLARISSLLDASPPPFHSVSSRGFTVITGRYQGIPISLIASGMVNLNFVDSQNATDPLLDRAHP